VHDNLRVAKKFYRWKGISLNSILKNAKAGLWVHTQCLKEFFMGTAWAMASNKEAAGTGAGGGIMGFLPMLVVIFVVMYFFIMRPQQKKQKEVANMLSNLKKGDKVATVGGMLGVVVGIKDDVVTLKFSENAKAEFRKSAIATVISHEGASE
jgi:preprotein translocase subunit YajC